MSDLGRERARAQALLASFMKQGLDIEAWLQPPYEAILIHSQSTIITGNEAAARLVGCTVADLLGMNAWTLFPRASATTVMEKLTSRDESPYQVIARRLDGTEIRVELKGIETELAGEPVRVVLLREVPGE